MIGTAAQYEQGKYAAAVATFRKAVAVRGQDLALLSWLGKALHETAEWEDAEEVQRQVLDSAGRSHGEGMTTSIHTSRWSLERASPSTSRRRGLPGAGQKTPEPWTSRSALGRA